MQNNEGIELKNRLKGTGKELGKVAEILGMTRQNLSYHLRKEKLADDFLRLVKEKSKELFHVEQITKSEDLEKSIGFIMEKLTYLQASERIVSTMVLALCAAANKTSYATEERELRRNVHAEVDRLLDELSKRS